MKKSYQKLLLLSLVSLAASNIYAQQVALSLEGALQQTAKGNRNLQVSLLEQQQAAIAVKEAKSFLLPSVNANAGYSVYGERPVIYLRNETASPKLDDVKYGGRFAFDGTVSASYPLLNPSIRSDIKQAGITEQIRKASTKETEEKLALEVSQLYYAILMHQEQRKVLEQSLERNSRALKDSRSLFLQGKNLRTDTLSNYLSVQNLIANISALNNNIAVLSLQLKQLMGVNDTTEISLADSLSLPHVNRLFHEPDRSVTTAMDNRKDIQLRLLRIDQAKEEQETVKAAFRPQLWAVAQYQVQAQSDNAGVWENGVPRTSFAGLRVSMPLYSGNRLRYKSSAAALAVKQQELEMDELQSTVQTELVSVRSSLAEAYDQWHIKQESVAAALVNYTMMNDRYRMGLSSRLELTDAELALTKAKLEHLQAVFSIRLLDVQYKRAMGLLQLN